METAALASTVASTIADLASSINTAVQTCKFRRSLVKQIETEMNWLKELCPLLPDVFGQLKPGLLKHFEALLKDLKDEITKNATKNSLMIAWEGNRVLESKLQLVRGENAALFSTMIPLLKDNFPVDIAIPNPQHRKVWKKICALDDKSTCTRQGVSAVVVDKNPSLKFYAKFICDIMDQNCDNLITPGEFSVFVAAFPWQRLAELIPKFHDNFSFASLTEAEEMTLSLQEGYFLVRCSKDISFFTVLSKEKNELKKIYLHAQREGGVKVITGDTELDNSIFDEPFENIVDALLHLQKYGLIKKSKPNLPCESYDLTYFPPGKVVLLDPDVVENLPIQKQQQRRATMKKDRNELVLTSKNVERIELNQIVAADLTLTLFIDNGRIFKVCAESPAYLAKVCNALHNAILKKSS